MGIGAAIFESAGKRTEHYVPGVYSCSYNVTSPSGVSAGNLCILGSSTGGKPDTLLEFGSLADAKNILGSGNLLEAVAYAFNGSNDYVPQRVYAMRVNQGEQSSITLKSGDADVIKIKSSDYSVLTNQLKIKIENGTAKDSKKITLAFKDNINSIDNIVKPSLSIMTACNDSTVTITSAGIQLKGTDDEGEDVSENFNFEDFPTINSLVARINETSYFAAVAIDSDDNAKTNELDALSPTTIDEQIQLFSNVSALIESLKSLENIGDVEFIGLSRQVPDNIPYTYFVGGATSTATIQDWNNALEVLKTEDIQIIATPSTDNDVQALIANHCTEMNTTVNRKGRTCWLGGVLNETDDKAISKANGFNNKLVSYVTDCPIVNNPLTGATETINGAMHACMFAGMESAMAVNMPLTNKKVKVLGYAKKRTITNLEKLIKAGICVSNPSPDDPTSYIVIRALTTYQGDDLISNERSMVREDLYMNRDLRNRFASTIGQPNNISKSDILATLNDAAKDWADSGYIVPSDDNENVWNKSVRINRDKIYITYSRYLTAPTNFIFITATNHIYTSTVEV